MPKLRPNIYLLSPSLGFKMINLKLIIIIQSYKTDLMLNSRFLLFGPSSAQWEPASRPLEVYRSTSGVLRISEWSFCVIKKEQARSDAKKLRNLISEEQMSQNIPG